MCGIFALAGTTDTASEYVLEGLKKLEYRGYDSWGIATLTNTSVPQVHKGIGKISKVSRSFPKGAIAFGHTRWATHGSVTKKNAHPHQQGRVTLVHNGVVENVDALRKELQERYRFSSVTDSEVVAALIDSYLSPKANPKAALRKAAKRIQGRFALVVHIADTPGLWAIRRGSPLIIGRSSDATYIASDIPAFLSHTRTVNYLDDDEMAHVLPENVCAFSLSRGAPVPKRDVSVAWSEEHVDKGDWQHFMLKEIFEQKETILRTLEHTDTDIKRFARALTKAPGVYIIGSGTSHKAAMVAEYFFATIAGIKVNVVPSAEMHSFGRFVKKGTAVIAISQSGETADALEVLEHAATNGATILSATNVPSSSIARMSKHHLALNTGPEKAVASTKAMTAHMALLFLVAHEVASQLTHGRQLLENAGANINDMLNPRYEEHIVAVAQKIADQNTLFIIGRNTLFPIALEAAIKIQEVSYIHAQGFAAGELKHGPIALVEKGTVCIVLGDDPETLASATELHSRGATLIGITPTAHKYFSYWIRVPDCAEAQAIATVVPIQLLAYHLAAARGLDPDMPRNLAKSVTVK